MSAHLAKPPDVTDHIEVSEGLCTAQEATTARPQLREILAAAISHGASDVHIRPGNAPLLRVSGQLYPLDLPELSAADTRDLIDEALVVQADRAAFEQRHECDFALTMEGLGRFRANAYRTRGADAMVLRHVHEQVPSLDELGLPRSVRSLALATGGILLVCGPTGSGKSTSLAAIVDYINSNRRCHILTIEDPIEYLHPHKLSTVSQRELHTDTSEFASALRAGMRQDPDVILIGEIRDAETLRTALQAAQTGHFVLASMHARSVVDAVHRIVDSFPLEEQRQIRASFAESMQAIICQHLAKSARNDGRVLTCEIAVSTPRVKDAICDPERTAQLHDIIADGDYYGMHTFEQDLVRLVLVGDLAVEQAETVSSRPADLHVALRRAGHRD
ncbi:MAG: PilT/PilU family type 4a pilus ATPase [Actinomycetota bacterium]|nr:PilT/PilU family type 4a pilus ATPase [Actinomycetota bacterium]